METRRRKRLRRMENSVKMVPPPLDITLAKSANSNKVKSFDENIPGLVAEIFLSSLRDVQLLKTCRFVCKSWNITASESLRTCSLVRLTECESTYADFTSTLIGRSFGPLQHVSTPFRNFHVEGKSLTHSAFVNLTLQPNIAITSLSLKLDNRLDQSKLGLVLAANKANITDLKIVGRSSFVSDVALLAKDDIRLESLKRFEFDDSCDRCTHIAFLRIILKVCTPERIDLRIQDGNILSSVLSPEIVEHLKHLGLDFKEISSNAWEHLSKLRFLRLKTSKFHAANPDISLDYLQKWDSFCHNLTPTPLVEFETNIRISTKSDLLFPRLRILKVWNNNGLSVLNHRMFPCLVKLIYVVTPPLLRTLENLPTPHVGVRSVTLIITGQNSRRTSFDEDMLFLLTFLSRRFPKVAYLEISLGVFCCTTLTEILETFPKLTTLNLDGICDFFSFSGVSTAMVNQYSNAGWSIETIPRRKSITDFLDLETLIIGPRFVVLPDMIKHCLPRVPKLKSISLHWNQNLSVSLLRDYLGHLEKIIICNSAMFQDAMAQVKEMLPNAQLQ